VRERASTVPPATYAEPLPVATKLTRKGAATRSRIVETAAQMVLARGVGGTTLDDVCAGASTGKSQLFHYFPGGKTELVAALAEHQYRVVLAAQQPHLDDLSTWSSWEAWRASLLELYGSQPSWGCPIGALVSELIGNNPDLATEIQRHMDDWRERLRSGVERLRDTGALREDCDPQTLALGIFAAVQGGLLLVQTMQSVAPLSAALDGALSLLRSQAAD
jgi:AcrR family transcriptional regulator